MQLVTFPIHQVVVDADQGFIMSLLEETHLLQFLLRSKIITELHKRLLLISTDKQTVLPFTHGPVHHKPVDSIMVNGGGARIWNHYLLKSDQKDTSSS